MPTRIGMTVALATAFFISLIAQATAERNVALVIGNSDYKSVSRLTNPANDATAVTTMLKNAGFEVVDSRRDLGIADMRKALRDFANTARDADIAVVYYAGHGIEVDGNNYLVPIDAVLAQDVDVEDEAMSLDRVLRVLEPVKRLRLVILDACRDNPFSRSMKRTLGTRSVGRGLAKVEPTNSDTLVAYAAKAGSTASDGDSGNSPFATALVKNLTSPGLDLRLAFGRVRDDVLKSTGNRQEPFVYGSLGGETLALVPAVQDPEAESRRDYELAAQVGTKQAWESFLSVRSTGLYANLARAQYDKLRAAEQASLNADDATRQAEALQKQKFEQLRRQAEEQAARDAEETKRKISEQSKRELEDAKRKFTEQAQRELDEARRQVEEAKKQASDARRQVDEAKKQAVEEARGQIEEASRSAKPDADSKLAALTPATQTPSAPAMDPGDIARLVQAHLKRVGCDPGATDGNWNDRSKKALEQFNKAAGTKFDVKLASLDLLDAIRTKTARVCPLVCDKGQKVDGDHCVQISCDSGQVLNSNGVCVKRHDPAPRPVARAEPRAAAPAPRASAGGGGGKCFNFNGKRFCE